MRFEVCDLGCRAHCVLERSGNFKEPGPESQATMKNLAVTSQKRQDVEVPV
jgi:hypothetical protein